MTKKPSKTTEYHYTKLSEVQVNTKSVNVFGVVRFARPPTKTRGSGLYDLSVKEFELTKSRLLGFFHTTVLTCIMYCTS